MQLQSEIEAVKVSSENDAPFTVRNASEAYYEEGAIRTRLGKTFLTAKSVARYKQLEDQTFAEKYLVGTLLSAVISIACVGIYNYFKIYLLF